MDCLVLAGGTPRPGEALHAETRGLPKALLEVGGERLVDRVLRALAGSAHVDGIVLVGLAASVEAAVPVEQVADAGSWAGNFYAGVDALVARGAGERAMFCWCDLPLVTAAMIDRFVAAAAEPADVHAGLVARAALEARFPEVDERYLRFREGEFVAADVGLFRPSAAGRLRPQLEALAGERKSAWRQARLVSWTLLLRYLLRRLTVAELERRLGSLYGVSCRIHVVDDPELGLDVDGPANLAIWRRVSSAGSRR